MIDPGGGSWRLRSAFVMEINVRYNACNISRCRPIEKKGKRKGQRKLQLLAPNFLGRQREEKV